MRPSLRLLALLVAALGAASSAAARQLPPGTKGSARLLASKALYGSDGAPLFSLSTHLGIEHCTLPGHINGSRVHMHVWIRSMFLEPTRPGATQRVQVKGFALLESLAETTTDWRLHLEEHSGDSYAWLRKTKPSFFLKPLHGGNTRYHLETSYNHNGVIAIQGLIELNGTSIEEFEVVLQDFNHFCLIIPEPDGGAPSTLGQPNRTIMLISPYFDYTGQQVASLLAWHMAWHEKMGVDETLLYVTEGMPELLQIPQMHALAESGKLKLIFWQDLALPDPDQTSKMFYRYAHQTVIYNHAVLAAFARNNLLLVADLDEYLVTPQRMTVKEMIASCAPGRVVAALRLERFNVFNKQLLEQGKGESTLWMETAEQLAGSQLPDVHQHPLTKYSQCSDCNAKQLLFKSIYQAQHVSSVHIHYGMPQQGTWGGDGPNRCARWLHVANQARGRYLGSPLEPLNTSWLWQLQA